MTVAVLQPLLSALQAQAAAELLAGHLYAVRQACRADPLLVVLPEYWYVPQEPEPWWRSFPYRWLRDRARELGIYLVGGSVPVREEEGRIRNRALCFGPDGQMLGYYDKRRPMEHERQRGVEPGQGASCFSIGAWRVGVLICADLWDGTLIPEGVDLLVVQADTVVLHAGRRAYARRLWHALALVRAQERLCVVAVSDRARYWDGRRGAGGASAIVDPAEAAPGRVRWGELMKTLPRGRPGWLYKELDRKRLEAFRAYRRARGLALPDGGGALRGVGEIP